MGVSYEEAVKAQTEIEDRLLDDPNVVSVGVIKEINDLGQKTGDYIIQVGVVSVETYLNTVRHGKSIIPKEYILPPHDMEEEKHIRVHVVKEGQIQALLDWKPSDNDLPSANDDIPDAQVGTNNNAFNYVDVAVAEVLGGLKWSKYVKPYVSIIGKPNDFIDAKIDMEVEKTGRTTGYTQGQITSINETIKVNYSQMGIVKFKNQIRTTSMSKGGDSGSCLFKKGTKEPVALLFAGSNSASFYNPMKMILSSLSMSWTNKYPSGNNHSFPSVPSFKILKRPYSTQFFSDDIKKDTKLKTVVPSFQSPKGSGQLLANFGILATPKQFRTKGASIMYKTYNHLRLIPVIRALRL
jgi:hypothetical protein